MPVNNEYASLIQCLYIFGLVYRLLNPIQKPGQQRGPLKNLRLIILLINVHKILISLLERIWVNYPKIIQKSQVANQKGRGITDQVLALKILIVKAITSCDYNRHV